MALAPKMIGAGFEAVNKATAPVESNAAISEGLHVPARSPKMAQTVKDVNAARPYLEGVQNQAELQQRIPAAKAEIWDPYQKAVDSIKNQPTQLKNPQTGNAMTVGELEAERQTLSARLQTLRKAKPTDQATILQKETDLANLKAREGDVINALDPELQKAGVDPKVIRRVHGNVKGVERLVSGKSTVTEPEQAYGVRKLIPYKAPSALGVPEWQWKPIEGIQDIRSGQPWSGKPTDVGISRVFKKQ
jgi:hypothetical protein